jgi:hypothetical protein
MQFLSSFTVLALVIITTALPNKAAGNRTSTAPDNLTFGELQDACGYNLELDCCATKANDMSSADVNKSPGVVGGVLDDLSVFDQCSTVSFTRQTVECPGKLACCQRSPSNAGSSLPCIALKDVIQ